MKQQDTPQQAHTPGKTVALRLVLFVMGMTALMVVVKIVLGR